MANTIKIKQSSVASNAPAVGDLVQGELAVNTADEKLYSKNSSNVIFEIGGGGGGGASAWVFKTTAYTAVAGDRIAADTTSAAFSITLPTSATAGDLIEVIDNGGDLATNNLTIARNGHKIDSVAEDAIANVSNTHIFLQYVDVTVGWDVFGILSGSGSSYTLPDVPSVDGIQFPAIQVPDAGANVLDDYEEGTWTGEIEGSVSAATSPATATGIYTKIGHLVSVSIYFEGVNTSGASGDLLVTGLPFTTSATSGYRGAGSAVTSQLAASGVQVEPYVVTNATKIGFLATANNTGWTVVPVTAGTAKHMLLSMTYVV